VKLSNYNLSLDIEDKCAVYNTISRKYVLFDGSKKEYVNSLLKDLSRDKYEVSEGELLKEFIRAGIIVDDNLNEFDKITYLFNKVKYQENRFILIISPTLDCNFRCPYCFEERRDSYITDEAVEGVIELVKKVSKKVKVLQVCWFGGEPMLQFEKIKTMTKVFKEICEKEGVSYCSTMTTNGYLLNDELIEELKALGIKKFQITLDGHREFHNKKRPLADGSGTFDKVLENIIKASRKDIAVTLRINVDKENANSIPELLDSIPEDIRKKVGVNICNIFQNKEMVPLAEYFKTALNKGFQFRFFRKNYEICEGTFINSITVQPDGKITPCQMCNEKGFHFGKLRKDGSMNITKPSEFYKFRTTSAIDNESCKKCSKFPLCLGGCYYNRYKNNKACVGTNYGGIELEDFIRLEIYNDVAQGLVKETEIV